MGHPQPTPPVTLVLPRLYVLYHISAAERARAMTLTREDLRDALAPMQADLAALKAKVDTWPDLSFLQTAAQRQQTDAASLRDDMRVLTAIVMRLDGSHSVLLDELRATHAQIARLIDRVRKLEDESTAPPL